MEKKLLLEIIRNGKVVNVVESFDELDEVLDTFYADLRKEKYKEIESLFGAGRGHHLFFNENKLTTEIIAWREKFNFTDKNGNSVYPYGHLINEWGVKAEIAEHSESFSEGGKKWLYMTALEGNSRWEITPKEISKDWAFIEETKPFPEIPSPSKDEKTFLK